MEWQREWNKNERKEQRDCQSEEWKTEDGRMAWEQKCLAPFTWRRIPIILNPLALDAMGSLR